MSGVLDNMNDSLGGVDQGMFAQSMREVFSFKANIFDSSLDVNQMVFYVLAGIVFCIAVQILVYTQTYKKK